MLDLVLDCAFSSKNASIILWYSTQFLFSLDGISRIIKRMVKQLHQTLPSCMIVSK